MVALVLALAAIGLGQFDPLALDLIDSPNVDAVGADDFHMLFDFGHSNVLCVDEDNARVRVPFIICKYLEALISQTNDGLHPLTQGKSMKSFSCAVVAATLTLSAVVAPGAARAENGQVAA